jgi:hypothetical protein
MTIRQLLRVSAILVIAMGLMMANRGLKMTQSGFDLGSLLPHLSGKMERHSIPQA